jgi:3-methylfumaryl-CoA hydratase
MTIGAEQLEGLKAAIGRGAEAADTVAPRLIDAFRATLEPHLAPQPEGTAPLGIHWCLAPQLAPMSRLGRDGHPAENEFGLAPPLPRRMWAGGALHFRAPILRGGEVIRRSTFADVSAKVGRSGPLCFVTLRHDYLAEGVVALSERQDLVYREDASAAAARAADDTHARPAAEIEWRLTPDPVLLFRYSALTFNGHRIHYDEPYAREVEGQEGLLVHGPLQATWLLNIAATLGGSCPRRLDYRLLAPLVCGCACTVVAWRSGTGALEGTIQDDAGRTTASAKAEW